MKIYFKNKLIMADSYEIEIDYSKYFLSGRKDRHLDIV